MEVIDENEVDDREHTNSNTNGKIEGSSPDTLGLVKGNTTSNICAENGYDSSDKLNKGSNESECLDFGRINPEEQDLQSDSTAFENKPINESDLIRSSCTSEKESSKRQEENSVKEINGHGDEIDSSKLSESRESEEENLETQCIMNNNLDQNDQEMNSNVGLSIIPAKDIYVKCDKLVIGNTMNDSDPCVDNNVNCEEMSEKEGQKKKTSPRKNKIKLRSFASLCDEDSSEETEPPESMDEEAPNLEMSSSFAVGDIVEHGKFVESDESGVMHLKISDVVGGEDCITGLTFDEGSDGLQMQITSVSSLVEPFSNEESKNDHDHGTTDHSSPEKIVMPSEAEVTSVEEELDSTCNKENDTIIANENEVIVNIFKSSLIVHHECYSCNKLCICLFRVIFRSTVDIVAFLCNAKCKGDFLSNLPVNHSVQKPRRYFERFCGMCGKELPISGSSNAILSWQTREFCNKLCLADHIGEVARLCYYCRCSVRVIYMVKYCVRFGSEVHQFCCNSCLEMYKTTIKVCSFCQKNLRLVKKVISPSGKEYCSTKCLKRAQRRDVGQVNYKEQIGCTVCLKVLVNSYEFIHNGVPAYLCSNPCLNVFKYVNKVKSVNCCLCLRLMNAEDSSNYFFIGKQLKVFCTESCFSVFIISSRKIVTCKYCKVKKYNFDMISFRNDADSEFFCCSYCCLNFVDTASKVCLESRTSVGRSESTSLKTTDPPKEIALLSDAPIADCTPPTVLPCAADSTPVVPIVKHCNMCNKLDAALFHMVMSDSTLKSFCSYTCATTYKDNFGFQVSGTQHNSSKTDQGTGKDGRPKDEAKKTSDSLIGALAGASEISLPKNISNELKMNAVNLLCPPTMCNKSVSCRPKCDVKGIQCKIESELKSSEPGGKDEKLIIPIPVPMFVPLPFAVSAPQPFVIPVPVLIPTFIPTTEKTTDDIQLKIKAILKDFSKESPEDPTVDSISGDASVQLADEDSHGKALLRDIQLNLPQFVLNGEDVNVSNHCGEEDGESSISTAPPFKRLKLNCQEHLDCDVSLKVWRCWLTRSDSEDESQGNNEEDGELMISRMSSRKLCDHLIHLLHRVTRCRPRTEVDVLFYVFMGLQKHLCEEVSTHYIFFDANFDFFSTAFNRFIERHFQIFSHPVTKRLNSTRVSEEMLWEAKMLGAHTPYALLNTLFYFNTKFFKLKTPLEHMNLSFRRIVRKLQPQSDSASDLTFLHLTESQDGSGDLLCPNYIEENKSNQLRCPVKYYDFYLSKCPESVKCDDQNYYLYPERTCLPESLAWFSSDFLQIQSIDMILNRIMLVKEIQEALF